LVQRFLGKEFLGEAFLGEEFFSELGVSSKAEPPYLDLYESSQEVLVVIDLPGLEDVGSLEIDVYQHQLTVKGNLPPMYRSFQSIRAERVRGSFEKRVVLPEATRCSSRSARYRRGILEIRFPKQPPSQPTRDPAWNRWGKEEVE
jgi:HSP20 family protein